MKSANTNNGDDDEHIQKKNKMKESLISRFLPIIPGISKNNNKNKVENPLAASAIEKKVLKELKFNYSDSIRMLKCWAEMSPDKSTKHKMSYDDFLRYFNFRDETWIKRTFDIINLNLSGYASLTEFLYFSLKYLLIDKKQTEEFGFRLLSRRGSTFVSKWSIIDLEDIVNFISFRYSEIKKLPKKKKKALDIFTYMDSDGDGGLDIHEFHDFCDINPVFIKISHKIQNHMRKVLFGIEFWVKKSR